MNDNIRLVIQ